MLAMQDRGRASWAGALALFVGAADIGVLGWLGVGPARLAISVLFLAATGFAGALILRRREALFPDRFSFAIASLTCGLVLHMALCFVLLHGTVARVFALPDRRASAIAAFGVLCVMAFVQWHSSGRRLAHLPRFSSPTAASVVFALASAIAVAAHFGFGNDLRRVDHAGGPDEINGVIVDFIAHHGEHEERTETSPPEWGSRIDSIFYVWLIPRMLEQNGLPATFHDTLSTDNGRLGQFQHVGVSVQLLGLTDLCGRFDARSSAACGKFLVLVWMTIFGWWTFLIGRALLGLTIGPALAAVAGAYLFSPIELTLLFTDYTVPSHVLTYIATPIHWNMNQLAHLAIGFGGLFFVLRALADGSRTYTLGCALIAASLMYKPSLYFVAVPAIGIASLGLRRRLLSMDVVLGWAALLAAAVFWFAYPRLLGLKSLASPIDFSFLELQGNYVQTRVLYATFVAKLSPAAAKAVVLVLALAAWFIPVAYQIGSCIRGGAERRRALFAELMRPEIRALILFFAWGMFSAFCFVEAYDNVDRRTSNNYFFGGAAAYTACLPLLALAIVKVRPLVLRIAAWIVFAAHVASGVINLWIYVTEGRLT